MEEGCRGCRTKNAKLKSIGIGCFMTLTFLLLYFWMRSGDYSGRDEVLGMLCKLGEAAMIVWGCFEILKDAERFFRGKPGRCIVISWGMSILMFSLLILEMGNSGLSFYGERNIICLRGDVIPKECVWTIYVMVIFPFWAETVFASVKDKWTEWMAYLHIFSLTVIEYALFYALPNVWITDMALVNTVVVAFVLYRHLSREGKVQKWKFVCLTGIYGSFWYTLIRYSFSRKQNDMEEVCKLYKQLRNTNYVHKIMMSIGWPAAAGVMLLLVLFVIICVQLLGIRDHRRYNGQSVHIAAFIVLTLRAVMGLLRSLGFPYPESLPFMGDYSIFTDFAAVILLLECAWDNYEAEKELNSKIICISKYF